MATGAYDANGIWQYGEDDNIALFSDLLNLATESTSDAFTDDRARLATLEAGSLAGIIPVIPTSVTAVTGTAAVSTVGQVSYTGVTSIQLNGVFTAAYKNYRVITEYKGTNYAPLYVRVATAGTQVTSSYVFGSVTAGSTGSLGIRQSASSTALNISDVAPDTSGSVIDVYAPNLVKQTVITANSYYGGGQSCFFGGTQAGATAHDGIAIYTTTGTITGSISVYGYND